MSSPANVNCPCGGDAFKSRKWEGATIGCYWCRRHYTSRGKCLGPDGWPLMAIAGAEVARERLDDCVIAAFRRGDATFISKATLEAKAEVTWEPGREW